MDSIISTFHIDYKLMLAQLVNFGIIVGVLWYFVFKPLAAKMTERTKTIEKSLAEARQIADNLKSSEQQRHKQLPLHLFFSSCAKHFQGLAINLNNLVLHSPKVPFWT